MTNASKLISALQSMRDRLMGELPGRFGDAFDGDFDTLLDAINHLKATQGITPGCLSVWQHEDDVPRLMHRGREVLTFAAGTWGEVAQMLHPEPPK